MVKKKKKVLKTCTPPSSDAHRPQQLRLWFAAFRHFHQHRSRFVPRPVNSCTTAEALSQPGQKSSVGPTGFYLNKAHSRTRQWPFCGPALEDDLDSVLKLLHWAAGCWDDTSSEELTLQFFRQLSFSLFVIIMLFFGFVCFFCICLFLCFCSFFCVAAVAGFLFDEELCGCCQTKQLVGTLSSERYCVFWNH